MLHHTYGRSFSRKKVEFSLNAVKFCFWEADPCDHLRRLRYACQARAMWTRDADPLRALRYMKALESARKLLEDTEPALENLLDMRLMKILIER